ELRARCAGVYGRPRERSIGGHATRRFDLSKRARSAYLQGRGSAGRAARSEQMPIVNRIAAMHGEVTAWRRDIHAHPELLYDVQRTAATVADKLKRFGCDEVVTGLGRTGVVGVIRGGKGGEGGRVIGLRADMDALPIQEAGDVPYKSTVPGKMHACGHDGHTA